MRSAFGSKRFLVVNIFFRSSLLSDTGLVGPSEAFRVEEVAIFRTEVRELEGELIEVGSVCPAAGMEKSGGGDVLLRGCSSGTVVFMMEELLLSV